MASFDLETFAKAQGQTGTNFINAAGMAFGVPSCMLGLGAAALSLLPTPVLAQINIAAQQGKAKANEVIAEIFRKLTLNTGIIEFDTETGTFKFKSIISWMNLDADGLQALSDLGGIIGAMQYAASFGAQLYQNYQNVVNEFNAIANCLNTFKTMKQYERGNSASTRTTPLDDSTFAATRAELRYATDFVVQCDRLINDISNILLERESNPNLEPTINDCREFDKFLSGTTFCRAPVEDPEVGMDDGVFRLTYGPPVSLDGQYILTNDGLYYDSRNGGIDVAFAAISGIVPLGDQWKYNYDPNLGGKGQTVSLDSLNKYKDNLFDPDIIDDSNGLQLYYDADDFLITLRQQRDKHIYDLSSDLQRFINNGEGQSVITNQRQLIISEIANHNSKINRRKKQIEVAVKAPQIYGGQTSPMFAPGKIPINDFSYLANSNLSVDLEKQKALVFKQGDVNGIILPIVPKFVDSSTKAPSLRVDHLKVPIVGKGAILYTPSSTNAGTLLSLTDQLVTNGLFASYNFLQADIVLPSSIDFNILNDATEGPVNNCQLVAPSKRSVFFSGLGIPYLEGIVKNKSSDPAGASGLGSFVRLPDTTEFRDLMYSRSGFTIECWVHVPNITNAGVGWLSSTTSSLTKVLLGCENVGIASGYLNVDYTGQTRDLDYLPNDRGEQLVRGVLCGFTRDRRITRDNTGFSNSNSLNDPASSLSFFIAPTQSRDASSLSWINNDDCQNYPTFYKMKVDLSSTILGSVSSQFVLIDITCEPETDTIKIYGDGNLLATSSISNVFGVPYKSSPNLPTFKKDNSFEYSNTTVDGPTILKEGPLLNTFYTPWIVGGGYTDGMYQYGNFMGGGARGGVVSGLRGHIGSLKFYSRPLDNSEVSTNFNAQKGFFKNIRT
jgi:hypothetical protein